MEEMKFYLPDEVIKLISAVPTCRDNEDDDRLIWRQFRVVSTQSEQLMSFSTEGILEDNMIGATFRKSRPHLR